MRQQRRTAAAAPSAIKAIAMGGRGEPPGAAVGVPVAVEAVDVRDRVMTLTLAKVVVVGLVEVREVEVGRVVDEKVEVGGTVVTGGGVEVGVIEAVAEGGGDERPP